MSFAIVQAIQTGPLLKKQLGLAVMMVVNAYLAALTVSLEVSVVIFMLLAIFIWLQKHLLKKDER